MKSYMDSDLAYGYTKYDTRLDVGDGKDLDLKECPRLKLRKQLIKYLGPKEREDYEYIVVEGKITKKLTGELLSAKKTSEDTKWIFVMSSCKKLYIGEKQKGKFHHSSFLAGGATLAAGQLLVEDGTLKSISAYSGHYRLSDDHLDAFLAFLTDDGVDLNQVKNGIVVIACYSGYKQEDSVIIPSNIDVSIFRSYVKEYLQFPVLADFIKLTAKLVLSAKT